MKIHRSKSKKDLSVPPIDCKLFIDNLKTCDRTELHELLKSITIWHLGKCTLYDWIDALDLFDAILEEACIKSGTWMLNCDKQENAELKILVLDILRFTTLLIEHSYSRHLYNSMEHLIMLLQSSHVHIILGVLSLLYVFSKRSNFITRLQVDKKQALIDRVTFLAETWGGRENGFDLARCCTVRNPADFPEHAKDLHFAYTVSSESSTINGPTMQTPKQIEISNVHLAGPNAAAVMEIVLTQHTLSEDKQMKLFTHLRLAYAFSSFDQRLLCIQARLQALSILVYSTAIQEANNVLYDGLIEELVEVLNVRDSTLTDIKASALKTLTSIIYLERTTKHPPRLQEIIEATQANSYHGFLPALVRQCIDKLTDDSNERFPQSLSTALFSFLYHLASYETGGDALVNCGIMQSLIKVVNYYDESQDFIMFVTRAVRVIDLITTLDMTSFQTNNGLQAFINRLEHEIAQCRKEQPFIIRIPKRNQGTPTANLDTHPPLCPSTQSDISGEHPSVTTQNSTVHLSKDMDTSEFREENHDSIPQNPIPGLTCYHQRAALLKSILNYLKKAFTEPTMVDTTRHIMDGSLPNSLKHIISNVEYYGPSLFHLATDVVTSFIFQEPSQLSSLQDNGLTDVLMHALFKKDIPATRDVLVSLPNIFSSLCLNARGLENFMDYKPFHKFFRVLLSPKYLPAMKQRRGTDTIYGTASCLGNAFDELMRHQVSLRTEAMKSIITLLEQLVELGNNPKYCCEKPHSSTTTSKLAHTIRTTNTNTAGNDRNLSDDEYDDDEASLANRSVVPPSSSTTAGTTTTTNELAANIPILLNQTLLSENKSEDETIPIVVPLLDYITNIMRFVTGVISNNPTDDHAQEFVKLGGLKPLFDILQMKNLPIDFPSSKACQCVAALCKSILTLLVKDNKLTEMVLTNLDTILNSLTDFYSNRTYDGSLLIEELTRAVSSSIDPIDAINQSSLTPTLHQLSIVHSHISLLISLCKITQIEVQSILISFWGAETGLRVLKNLNKICLTLIWENSILLSLCSSETNMINQQFNKNDLLKLFPLINDLTTNEITRQFNIDEIMSMDTSDFTKLKLSFNIQQRIKTIKPLLCVSSKLGRASGELYNLLVRQCSTSQMRHARRFNQQQPTAAAKLIASTLAEILHDGFSFHLPANNKLTESQIEKFRLKFFICTIGFAIPMLFDERRRPYLLMLQQFELSKAQDALFSALEWTLDLINRQSLIIDEQQLSQLNNTYDASRTEFLNSALMLILRLVNIKSILESPHSIPINVQTERHYFIPFNPLHYLALTHKCAFHILTNSCSVLWDKPYLLKDHATKIIDNILSIFCHILRGESQLQDEEQIQQQQPPQQQPPIATDTDITGSSILNSNDAARLNEERIQSITSMGFSREHAIKGLLQANNNLELAVDYCVGHPQAVIAPQIQTTLPDMDIDMARALLFSLGREVDEAALANPIAALAVLSRDDYNANVINTNQPSNPNPDSSSSIINPNASILLENLSQQKLFLPTIEPLSKQTVDRFTDSIMLKIIDILPDTVYKMCELIVTTIHHNGISWRDHFLETIANDIKTSYYSLIGLLDKTSSQDDQQQQSTMLFLDDHQNSVLFSRTLLMSLLFEEIPFPCARIVEKFSLINFFCILIHRTTNYLIKLNEKKTPTWLAPAFIFLDLYEKVSLASKRRLIINENYRECTRVWQWFDERAVRWNNYPSIQNKQIDGAYANGEPACKIIIQRRNYLIQFSTMLQTNEDTHNKRPIMLTFVKLTPKTNSDRSTQVPPPPPPPTLSSVFSTSDTSDDRYRRRKSTGPIKTKKVEPMDTEQQQPQIDTTISVIESLADEHALVLTSDCVYLIRMPVDPDAIHALLRLILRLTRDYKYARHFTQSGGIQAILSLTQTSAFQGCASLITLIFRHIMEDDSNLRLAMEKAIRQALTGNHGGSIGVQPTCPGSHELNVILRILGPAMTRAPDIFLDVASNVLQLSPPSASRFKNPFITEDEHHIQTNLPIGPLILQARPTTTTTTKQDSAGEFAERLLVDLLDFLLTNDDANPKRLLSKSTVLRILAELIRSYANVAKLVSTKTFLLQENQTCSALSYILDCLLPGTNNQQLDYDKDIPALCRLFLVAMAACDHCLESQMNLVNEVKMSLNKISILPECDDKHVRLQALANIINTMMESCPASNTSQPQQEQHRLPQLITNNMIKIMYKRGLINDLARMIHSIELSSSKLADTVNAILKPIETLSRAIKYTTSLHVPAASRPHTSRPSTNQTNTSANPPSTTAMTTTPATTIKTDLLGPIQDQTSLDQSMRIVIDLLQSTKQQQKQHQTSQDSTVISTNNGGTAGTNNVEFDVAHPRDDTLEHATSSSSTTSDDQEDDDAEETDSPDEDIDMESANDIDREPQHSYSDDDEDITSEEDGDVRLTGPQSSGEQHDDEHDDDLDDDSDDTESDETHTGDELDETEGPTIGIHIKTTLSQSTDENLVGDNEPNDQINETNDNINDDTTNNNNNQEGVEDDGEDEDDEDEEDDDEEDEITEFEDDDGSIADYVNEMEFDEEVLSESCNNLMSPTDIDPILVSNLQGVRNRATGFPSLHDINDRVDPALPPPPMSVPALHPLLVHHADNQLSSDASSRFHQLGTTASNQTNLNVLSTQANPTTTLTFGQQNGPTTATTTARILVGNGGDPDAPRFLHDQTSMDIAPEANEGYENIDGTKIYMIHTPLARWMEESIVLDGPYVYDTVLALKSKITEPLEKQYESELQSVSAKKSNDDKERKKRSEEKARQEAERTQAVAATAVSTSAVTTSSTEQISSTTTTTTTTEQSTLVPPVESEVEWTTVVIDGGKFRVPQALEIDPSFLAVLPEEMRQDILTDQVRNFERQESQRHVQRAAANQTATLNSQSTENSTNDNFPSRTNQTATEAGFGEMLGEINPEFIQTLPPEIREELLAERRRTAATMGPPEFLRTLQPHLRQQIFADMDESQIGALPEDMANEARTLRAAMESQQQQYLRSRMVRNHDDMKNMLSNNTYHSTRPIRMYNLRELQEARNNRADRQPADWYPLRTGTNTEDLNSNTSTIDTRGRQLLDYESICCLLVLLFIDDTRLNFARLQEVLKNLCHHTQTRQWVIKALLSIINKSTGRAEYDGPTSTSILKNPSINNPSQTNNENENQQLKTIHPSWLTINFESAFGASTNVFKIQRLGNTKRHGSIQISVHAQACPIVCRQVLESLIILAKTFPEQFLPLPLNNTEQQTTKMNSPDKQLTSTPNMRDLSFWELLLKLDQSFNNRTNRSSTNPLQNISSIVITNSNTNNNEIDFESSPLASLLRMLDHPILNKNTQLMDKLFKLLSLISQSFQIHIITKKDISPSPLATSTPMNSLQQQNNQLVVSDNQVVLGLQLDLVIKALISKSCTEDGLEFATTLLLNVSKINQATRDKVLHLLLNGIRLLGKEVSEQIKQLLCEVQDYLSKNNDSNAKQQDLQLPAMVMLTSKTANQQFLLRILKVIIQLREATEKEQLDARTHFETELYTLIRRLDTLRQSLRLYFPSGNSTNQQNDILQPLDELANRLGQMRTCLQTVLNSNTNEQRQQIVPQQDIYSLIRQFESLIKDFHEPPLSTTMTTHINDVLQAILLLFPQINEPMDLGLFLPNQQSKLSDLLNINQLWDSLNDCLLSLAKLSDPHAVLVLQPAVEAFFLVHTADLDNENEKQKKKKKDREQREAFSHLECFGPAPTATAADRGEPFIAPSNTTTSTNELPLDAQKFVEFVRTHRMLLNQILRQSTQHLSEGPFQILTDYTSILHSDIKRKYFRHELDRLKENIRGEDLAVHVRHNHVFEDSYRELSRRTPEDWKHRFYIVFDDEEGQDPDGLLREWYSLITRSMFDSNYALFMIIPGDRLTYTPSPSSHINTNHSQYFKFIGRIIAKAIFDNKYMNCHFTRSFYKNILGIPVCYTDMESVDLRFYENLVMLLQNDVEQLGLDLTFSLDASEFGENKVIDLLPNGSRIVVTNENKHEFVRLVCQERLIGCIKQQINSFLDGFYDIIPKSLISIFNEQELELLISG